MIRVILLFIILLQFSCSSDNEISILPSVLEISSQEDIERYSDLLNDVTFFNGDIIILKRSNSSNQTVVSDLSIFDDLNEVSGDLIIADYDFSSLDGFNKLRKVGGVLLITSDSLRSISFPLLQEAQKVTFTFGQELISIDLPELSIVHDLIQISENPKLESISGFKDLLEINSLVISNNKSLMLIDGFYSLNLVSLDFILELNAIELTSNSLSAINMLNRLQCRVLEKGGLSFDWLRNLNAGQDISIRGNVQLEELCPLKDFVRMNPSAFSFNHSNGMQYNSTDLLEACE